MGVSLSFLILLFSTPFDLCNLNNLTVGVSGIDHLPEGCWQKGTHCAKIGIKHANMEHNVLKLIVQRNCKNGVKGLSTAKIKSNKRNNKIS